MKQAHEQKKPILMISLGPSRADQQIPGFADVKMDRLAGPVLRTYLDEAIRCVSERNMAGVEWGADGRTNTGPEIDAIRANLDKGVVKVPPEVEGPRAEG